MNLGRVFANAIVRRLAYVLVALLLAWIGIGRAEAHGANPFASEAAAYSTCVDHARDEDTIGGSTGAHCTRHGPYAGTYGPGDWYMYQCRRSDGSGCSQVFAQHYFSAATACPVDSPIDPSTGQCATNCGSDGWPDPTQPGQCLNEQKCKAKPALGAKTMVKGNVNSCVDGCQFSAGSGVQVCLGSGAEMRCTLGGATATGAQCAAGEGAPITDTNQECVPLGSGQTACMKPDGQHCYTAGSGKQICWQPGETGQKTTGDTLQKRDAGTTAKPIDPNLPNGDTLIQDGNPTTTTTTVKDASGTRSIATTTANYRTEHGTDAGGSDGTDSGEPGDGSGSAPGDGEGDGEEDGSASGGDTCGSPPVMTGDPVMAMAARQAYLVRCGSSLSDANADGLPDYLATDGLSTDHGEGAVEGKSAWADDDGEAPEIDESGYGLGRSCPAPPTITLAGMSRTIDTSALCDLGDIIAALVYLIALAHAAYIFGGNR